MTATVDDIKAAMQAWRAERKTGGRGQAIYDLNRWKGQQRKALDAEYERRLADIESQDDDPSDSIPPGVLDLVARATLEGVSRSSIRVALGKPTLEQADEVIALAKEKSGVTDEAFILVATEAVNAKGNPYFTVRLTTGEVIDGVYLKRLEDPKRHHLAMNPSPPGSAEILDRLWNLGVAQGIAEALVG